MSYQVLARKYRPASFEELEGQEHVLRALVNALENNRLHHAYLFTGTRGVGKTTIARILARCLNCEQGISAKPCGECTTCVEISEGRSVDLIEVDAASRTKVEDTRELLDNVQYMPTHSRFKVYLIDEVHMLSTHSFNALLKTLEEPPEHVKFLLATTDPKKLPVTVLSRCLQFNLKNLSPERVVSYLQQILPVEGIEFEEPALWLLGRAADGSMRDALSLTDQAISFGNNAVKESDVKMMLGSIDQAEVFSLLEALIAGDGQAILDRVNQLAEHAPDYSGLLAELMSVLHRMALAHAVPQGLDNSLGDREKVLSLIKLLSPEDVQLYYQIGLIGQRDLPYAPNLRSGFEMILLRMLAFTPEQSSGESQDAEKKSPELASSPLETANSAPAPAATPAPKAEKKTSQAHQILNSRQTENQASSSNAPQLKGSESSVSQTSASQTSASHGRAAQPAAETVSTDIIDFDEGAPTASQEKVVQLTREIPQDLQNAATAESTLAERKPLEPEHSETVRLESKPAESVPVPVKESKTASRTTPDDVKTETVKTSQPDKVPGQTYPLSPEHWVDILRELPLSGVTMSVAANCAMTQAGENGCTLVLGQSHASLSNKNHETRIEKALTDYYGNPIKLKFEIGVSEAATPAEIEAERREQARLAAVEIIHADVNVQKLIENFDGTLNTDSIEARQKNGT